MNMTRILALAVALILFGLSRWFLTEPDLHLDYVGFGLLLFPAAVFALLVAIVPRRFI